MSGVVRRGRFRDFFLWKGSKPGRRLYASALNVGRDHIGSLVNTLALAYFGGAMPLIVLLSLGNLPLSLSANSETIVGSIIAVLVASIGPPATFLVGGLYALGLVTVTVVVSPLRDLEEPSPTAA